MKIFKVPHTGSRWISKLYFELEVWFEAPKIWADKLDCFDFKYMINSDTRSASIAADFIGRESTKPDTICRTFSIPGPLVTVRNEHPMPLGLSFSLKESLRDDFNFYRWWIKDKAWQYADNISVSVLVRTVSKTTIGQHFLSHFCHWYGRRKGLIADKESKHCIYSKTTIAPQFEIFNVLNDMPEKITTKIEGNSVAFEIDIDMATSSLDKLEEFVKLWIDDELSRYESTIRGHGLEIDILPQL